MEWVESTGTTIEEAKEAALDRLGVHEDDAEFEVVADVTKGLFGRVKVPARVRARVRPATPRAKDDRRRGKSRRGRNRGERPSQNRETASQSGKGGKGRGRGPSAGSRNRSGDGKANGNGGDKRGSRQGGTATKAGEKDDRQTRARGKGNGEMTDEEPTMTLIEQADLAEEFVQGLAERFGAEVQFRREQVEDDEIRITVAGDDLGRMIGHRGTTAGAIDELVRTVLQRAAGSARNGRIRVDVGGVRTRRAEALANFARAQAEEARASGRARALEPMGAADRKVVHDALTDEAGVHTISEGDDPQRRVVIVPDAGDDGDRPTEPE